MNPKLKKTFSILLPLIVGIGLVYWQLSSLSKQEITKIGYYLENADYKYILLSLIISLFGYWSRAYRWKYSLNHLGHTTKFRNNFFAVCISYLVNLTIPRSGELTRAVLLKKEENIPIDEAFGTIVGERIIDFLIFLLFVCLGFLLQFDIISQFIFKHISPDKILILGVLGSLGFVLFLIIWKYAKFNFVLTIKDKLRGISNGLFSIFQMKKRTKFLLHSFSIWLSYFLMFYVTIFALPETSHISLPVVLMGFIFGTIAVGFSSGGLGAFPVSIQTVLMLYGINKSAGAALGWLVWTSQTALTILLGFTSYLLMHFLNKK